MKETLIKNKIRAITSIIAVSSVLIGFLTGATFWTGMCVSDESCYYWESGNVLDHSLIAILFLTPILVSLGYLYNEIIPKTKRRRVVLYFGGVGFILGCIFMRPFFDQFIPVTSVFLIIGLVLGVHAIALLSTLFIRYSLK